MISPSQRPLPDNTQHSQQNSTWHHTTLTTDLYLTTHNTHNRPLPDNTQHLQQTSTWQHTTFTTDLYLTTHNTYNRPLPDNTQHSQEADIHVPGGTRTSNPGKRATAKLHLRLRCHRDTHCNVALLCLIDNYWRRSETIFKVLAVLFYSSTCTVHLLLFCTMTNKCTFVHLLVTVQNKKNFQYCSYREINYGKVVYRNWRLLFGWRKLNHFSKHFVSLTKTRWISITERVNIALGWV